eukprot:PhM_4_TR8062/c0_g1_i1/m.80330
MRLAWLSLILVVSVTSIISLTVLVSHTQVTTITNAPLSSSTINNGNENNDVVLTGEPSDTAAMMLTTETTSPQPPLEADTDTFTICMLSYRAPLSLQHSLRSFRKHGLLQHPNLAEVLVYFQVFDKEKDTKVVDDVLKGSGVAYRVIGGAANLPVAEATFRLIRAVRTPYVLYLECDRPVVERVGDGPSYTTQVLTRRIQTGLSLLKAGTAHLFRLQLYASHDVDDANLPKDTYGRYPIVKSCREAPTYQKDFCLGSKRTRGHVFYTAYCKHWWKWKSSTVFADMCDSMCFLEWASGATVPRPHEKHRTIVNASVGEEEVYCTTSEMCNWTNQPTLYRTQWYVDEIMALCEKNREGCMGPPGRGSAVRQEIFLTSAWKRKKHRVCVSRGLFIHYEIDNRERSAPKA